MGHPVCCEFIKEKHFRLHSRRHSKAGDAAFDAGGISGAVAGGGGEAGPGGRGPPCDLRGAATDHKRRALEGPEGRQRVARRVSARNRPRQIPVSRTC